MNISQFSHLSFKDIGASRLVPAQTREQYIDMALFHYHKTLLASESALTYLNKVRGIDNGPVKQFCIGFGDRSLGAMLPDVDSYDGAMIRGVLQRFGFIKQNGREKFWGYLTVPIKDENGELVDIYGRRIAKYLKKNSPASVTLQASPISVFNAPCLKRFDSVILCTSPIEALSLLACGIENAVGLMGISSVNPVFATQLRRNGVKHVTLGFANTPQAQRYRVLVSKMLGAHGIAHEHLVLPKGADINNVYVKAREMMSLCQQLGVTLPMEALCH